MIAGMGYQFAGMLIDRSHYPPPGQMIDVGGHRLHLYCTGTGSPTVVLEAAAPGWSLYWSLVQPDVAKVTKVCAYDRAGLGWSERGPLPRTGQRMARELHQLLTRAGISGPYVFVGHSLGGFVARQLRGDVDALRIESKQVANRVGVLGAIQPMHRADAARIGMRGPCAIERALQLVCRRGICRRDSCRRGLLRRCRAV
jgi:pimeloyl-ACP methyl ester carboxylesterase